MHEITFRDNMKVHIFDFPKLYSTDEKNLYLEDSIKLISESE